MGCPEPSASAEFEELNQLDAVDPSVRLLRPGLAGAKFTNTVFVTATGLHLAVFDSQTIYNQWTLFPPEFHPAARGLTLVPSPRGDFDGDDLLQVADLELLGGAVRGFYDFGARFDLDGNGVIDREDQRIWVKELKLTWYGDANLDGRFNSPDLVQVFQRGEYEDRITGNSTA